MKPTHLWWNGYEHAPGATAKEAKCWLVHMSGCTDDECEGDGWTRLPDDMLMRDENGRVARPWQTAAEYAREIAPLVAPRSAP